MAQERVIVIGAGGISNAWFPPLKAENVQVAAVVDLKKENAEAQIAKYELSGAQAYGDLPTALRQAKADFALDLTIPDAHCAVTCQALEAGLPVIGEKPMAASMDQAKKMVKTSEKTGKLYMVSQSRRWNPHPPRLRAAMDNHQIGELTTLNCDFYIGAHFGGFRDEMDSPLILDMAIHQFDLARMLCQCDPVSVFAEEFNPKGSWYKGDVAANCLFEMSGGVRFTFRGSWCAEGCHTGWDGDWRVIGTQGTLHYTDDKTIVGELVDGQEGFFQPKRPAEIPPVSTEPGGMHGALREMLRYLRTGQKPQTECHDNIKSLAMVFAAIESSKAGKRVAVKWE